MTLARWTAVATLVTAFHLQAQSPVPTFPAPPATSPTMEQTLNFMNESLVGQGEFTYDASDYLKQTISAQKVQLVGTCGMLVDSKLVQRSSLGLGNAVKTYFLKFLVRLDRTDPLSISVVPDSEMPNTAYDVVAKRTSFTVQPAQTNATVPTVLPSSNYGISGIVRATSGNTLTVISGDGRLLDITVVNDAFISKNQTTLSGVGNIGIGDIVAGDLVNISETIETKGSKIKSIQQQVMVTTNTEDPRWLIVARFSEKETAEHMAKAFLHAVILCNKTAKAPLF
jgi:hypothetical protein